MEKKRFRILIAGVGNELRRDDGFGQAVIKEAARKDDISRFSDIIDFGQRLYDLLLKLKEYDVAIIVDAMEGEGKPGDIYLLELEAGKRLDRESREFSNLDLNLNLHDTDLGIILTLGDTIGLPEKVYLVGCHPQDLSWGTGLTQVVQEKIGEVLELIHKIIKNYV